MYTCKNTHHHNTSTNLCYVGSKQNKITLQYIRFYKRKLLGNNVRGLVVVSVVMQANLCNKLLFLNITYRSPFLNRLSMFVNAWKSAVETGSGHDSNNEVYHT